MASNVRGIPLSKISPHFLHSNSTSHTWVFSAFAEIIDNAYDPDVSASELLIDKVDIRDVTCLIFLDNGAGMEREKLHKMLSFGFCEKDIYESNASHQPIGHYGNGFKSGSMRIGRDALVFTRSECSASIGFLSQTYLRDIKAESVLVPILDYRLPKLERIKSQESRNNLDAILNYSVFKFEEELKAELRALEGSKTGTKIIVSNLRRLESGSFELDFASDPTDIRCPEAHEADMTSVYHRPLEMQSTSEYKLSLREYCSILFLKPRMKITIRGHRVKSKLISKSLRESEQDSYSPSWLTKPVKIIFGFTCDKDKSEDYGLMLYHRNRLIKAFERVGYQKQPNDRGVGVVGVAQVDFLQPIHNKQDFKWDEKFNSVMKAFATKLNEYWNEKVNPGNPSSSQQKGKGNLPDWTWAQCDHCLKWRRLPDSINPESLPDKWYCRYNRDGTHNRCDIPEEPEDEDLAVKPRFEKTFKKKQEEQKRQQRMRQMEEESKKKQEMERQLKQKEDELKALQRMRQPRVDPRARELELALAEAQRCIEEQARLMEQMASGSFPSPPPPPGRKGQPNGSKSAAQSSPAPQIPGHQMKRRATVESLPTKENKKLCIKTETGEVLSITRNFADDEEVTEQDASSNTVTKKTPGKSKGAPLKVSMPFPSSRANHSAEKLKEMNGVRNTRDSSTPVKPAVSSKEKSHKNSKSKSTSNDVIDLTDDSETFSQPVIKPDPDATDSSSSQKPSEDSRDVKPDKESLDAKMREDRENTETNQESSPTLDLSSHTEPADQPPENISETMESNLETALAAIRERADQERLGLAATGSQPHQHPALSSDVLGASASEEDQSGKPGKDSSTSIPTPHTQGSPPTQAARPNKTGKSLSTPEKTSLNTAVNTICEENDNSVQHPEDNYSTEVSEQGKSSDTDDTLPVPNLGESSQTLKSDKTNPLASKTISEAADNDQISEHNKDVESEDVKMHDAQESIVGNNSQSRDKKSKAEAVQSTLSPIKRQNSPVTIEKIGSSQKDSENGSSRHRDATSENDSSSKTNLQSSDSESIEAPRIDNSTREQSHKSSIKTAGKEKKQKEPADQQTTQNKSPEQVRTKQASKYLEPGASQSVNGVINISISASSTDTTVDKNISHSPKSTVNDDTQLSHCSKPDSIKDIVENHSSVSQVDSSPQPSSPQAVPDDDWDESNDGETLSEPSPPVSTSAPEPVDLNVEDSSNIEAVIQRETPTAPSTDSCGKTTCSVLVQTDMDSSQSDLLTKMKKNVYRLLQLLAPGKDLGDLDNIDQLLEDMIRDKELASQSQASSLTGDSQE